MKIYTIKILIILIYFISCTYGQNSVFVEYPQKTTLTFQPMVEKDIPNTIGASNYKVYFIFQSNSPENNIQFNSIAQALTEKNQLDIRLLKGDRFLMQNKSPNKWLFIPFGFRYPLPEPHQDKSLYFFQDFFTDSDNNVYSPMLGAALDNSIIKVLSRHRAIEILENIKFEKEQKKVVRTSHVAVLLDISGSMADKEKLTKAKEAVKKLIDSYREQENFSISIITFATTADIVLPLTLASKIDCDEILDPIVAQMEEDLVEKKETINGKECVSLVYTNPGFTNMAAAFNLVYNKVLIMDKDELDNDIERHIVLICDGLPIVIEGTSFTRKKIIECFKKEQNKTIQASQKCQRIGIKVNSFLSFTEQENKDPYAAYRSFELEEREYKGLPSQEEFFKKISTEYTTIVPEKLPNVVLVKIGELKDEIKDNPLSPYWISKETIEELTGQTKDAERIKKEEEAARALKKIQDEFERNILNEIRNNSRDLVGIFMLENDNEIVMLDWFNPTSLLQSANYELSRRYASYAIGLNRIISPDAEQNSTLDLAKILQMFLNSAKPGENRNYTSQEICRQDAGDYQYQLRYVSFARGRFIGYYSGLKNNIFHFHLLRN